MVKLKGLTPASLESAVASKTGTLLSGAGGSCFLIFATSPSAFPIIFETSSIWGSEDASYSPINSPLRSTVILSLISYT